MDELQRSIYVDRFRLALHTQQGTAFQDWFVRLAGHLIGNEVPIRLHLPVSNPGQLAIR